MDVMCQPDGGDDEEFSRWREARRRHSPPSNEVPGIAAVEAVLGATEDLAVFVCGMEVYSTGVKFRVEARARRSSARGRSRRRVDLAEGMFRDGPGQRPLLLGVEFSNGRRASTLGHDWVGEVAAPEQPVLADGGGGGSDREADLEMFLSPLPPSGDLLLVCRGPMPTWRRPSPACRSNPSSTRRSGYGCCDLPNPTTRANRPRTLHRRPCPPTAGFVPPDRSQLAGWGRGCG